MCGTLPTVFHLGEPGCFGGHSPGRGTQPRLWSLTGRRGMVNCACTEAGHASGYELRLLPPKDRALMGSADQTFIRNRLLLALRPQDLWLLRPHLEPVQLRL